jgi:hypothetical protein
MHNPLRLRSCAQQPPKMLRLKRVKLKHLWMKLLIVCTRKHEGAAIALRL